VSTSQPVIVEIRAAEGGADARLLVVEQLRIYVCAADWRGL
jgi:protein subunit release factor A